MDSFSSALFVAKIPNYHPKRDFTYQRNRKMAEGGKAKSLADFRRINSEYQERLKSTHEEIGRTWLTFMEQGSDPIASRRRIAMGRIIDLVPVWREMANQSEVVLGSGEMLNHAPLYKLINGVNWPNPDPRSFAVIAGELLNLMSRVSTQIAEDADKSTLDAEKMVQELQQHGILLDEEADANQDDPTSDHSTQKMEQQGPSADTVEDLLEGEADADQDVPTSDLADQKMETQGPTADPDEDPDKPTEDISLLEATFGIRKIAGADVNKSAPGKNGEISSVHEEEDDQHRVVMIEATFGFKNNSSE